jgi:hypothetical protein
VDHRQRDISLWDAASKEILNDQEIWQIVDYIRHLPAKGSLEEPPV